MTLRRVAVPLLASAFTTVFVYVNQLAWRTHDTILIAVTLALASFAAVLTVVSAGSALLPKDSGYAPMVWVRWCAITGAVSAVAAAYGVVTSAAEVTFFFGGMASGALGVVAGVVIHNAALRKAAQGSADAC